ncbi:MAG: hypothetical protein QF824_05440 [Candidatus Woesearchaeota archaeon]|jgi:hypothetical protein|nr:hypothetical protein [Candidatus Woesearchaeota archaeon]|tara:strand:+ start:1152 stop:1532 length:381 start_codon:yes stop_codon:yes gene_type:complete
MPPANIDYQESDLSEVDFKGFLSRDKAEDLVGTITDKHGPDMFIAVKKDEIAVMAEARHENGGGQGYVSLWVYERDHHPKFDIMDEVRRAHNRAERNGLVCDDAIIVDTDYAEEFREALRSAGYRV